MSNDKEYGADAKPRCANHKGTPTQPKGCRTCARIAVERRIVRKVVDDLLAKGYALATDQGDHRFYGECNPSRDRAVILHELMQVDEEHLGVFDAKDATGVERVCQPFGWIYFVYGNDGYDVISDYTTNLEDQLKDVNAMAERLGEGA